MSHVRVTECLCGQGHEALDEIRDDCGYYEERPPSGSDLIAVVRRGVESGTIEGEEKGWCSVHDAQSWDGRDLFCLLHPGDPEERSCQMERRLVIPVSDGGSET